MKLSQAEMIYYQTLCQERNNYDLLVWQTPVLSLTGQAFLLTIALNPNSSFTSRLISAFLACITAFASVLLLTKHRFSEREMCIKIEEFEKQYHLKVIHSKPYIKNLWERISSYRTWLGLLIIFGVFSLLIILLNFFIPCLFY